MSHKRSLALALVSLVAAMLPGQIASVHAAPPYRILKLVLNSGKEMRVENPHGTLELNTTDYMLRTDLGLVQAILPRAGSGHTVTFNDGSVLPVESISGQLTYHGDFGRATLPWSSVREAVMLKDDAKRTLDQSFNRDFYRFKARLRFRSSQGQVVHLDDGSMVGVRSRYQGATVDLWLSRSNLKFDWAQRTVRSDSFGAATLELPIEALIPPKIERLPTDLGSIAFAWSNVVESEALEPQARHESYRVALSGGATFWASSLDFRCAKAPGCVRLNSRRVERVVAENIDRLVTISDGQAKAVFADGTEAVIAADELSANVSSGRVQVALSPRELIEVRRTSGTPMRTKAVPQRLRFVDGQELRGVVTKQTGYAMSTTLGQRDAVVKLLELPVAFGLWLASLDLLHFVKKGAEILIPVGGEQVAAPSKGSVWFETAHAEYEVPVIEIGALEVVGSRPGAEGAFPVSVTTRDGKQFTFNRARLQFVRYPDRIYPLTYYRADLGAWYWRRAGTIAVNAREGRVDVDLSRVKRVRIGGTPPSADIEVEARASGSLLHGQVVPAEVVTQGPGIASWNLDREGFWIETDVDGAALFLAMKSLLEIRIGTLP